MAETQVFKLARIHVPAFTELTKVEYENNGQPQTNAIRRSALFSRMFSINKEDFGSCERFVFSNDSDVYAVSKEDGKFVYTLNENGNRFDEVDKYDNFAGSQSYEEIMKKVKREIAKHKLSGRKTPHISDDTFQDGADIELTVKNGDLQYQCEKHETFIRPIVKLYVPVKADNDNGYELKEIPYGNTLYRITEQPTKNSYISIPKNTPYVFENVCEEDEACGAVEAWHKGNQIAKQDAMDKFTADDHNTLCKVAIDPEAFNFVDFGDENTEFFMNYTGVESAPV